MILKNSIKKLLISVVIFSSVAANADWTCYYQRTDEAVINSSGQLEYPIFSASGSFESITKSKAWAACQADKQGGAFSCNFLGCE